jgi:hypothetical protein
MSHHAPRRTDVMQRIELAHVPLSGPLRRRRVRVPMRGHAMALSRRSERRAEPAVT